jgi:glycosyltransferase involved in cell wall biosynthesis
MPRPQGTVPEVQVTLVGPTNPYKGGIAQHTTRLAERLAAAGHDVDLLSWSAQYPQRLYPGSLELAAPDTEPAFPGTRWALRWNSPRSWWRAAELPAHRSDLVVLCVVNGLQVPAYRTILERSRRAGRPVVALCHNVVPHEAGRLQRAAIGSLLRRVDRVLVHSADEACRARQLGVERVVTSPLPFHFPAHARAVDVHREATGRVLTFGLVRPYKGVDVLIDALALTDAPVRATVAGEFWTPVDELHDRAVRRGVAERVELVDGYLEPEQVLDLLERHDALVLPYHSGTGSQQPRIAHLVRTPVIASEVGSFPDQVVDQVDGFLVPPGSTGHLAQALDHLYEPGRLDHLRAAVRPPDPSAEWARYVEQLLSDPSSEPSSGTGANGRLAR